MAHAFKVADRVVVYQDPVTREKSEGEAVVLAIEPADDHYQVGFPGTDEKFYRFIYPDCPDCEGRGHQPDTKAKPGAACRWCGGTEPVESIPGDQ